MNIFKQLITSLYSPKDIATFRNQGFGKTILYVFMLMLLTIIPTSIYFGSFITHAFQSVEQAVANEMPPFQIKNGELSVKGKQPLVLDKDTFQIYLDDSGKLSPDDVSSQSNGAIALLQHDFVIVAGGETQTTPYSVLSSTPITKDDLANVLKSADSILPIAIAILVLLMYIFALVTAFIKISILALIGIAIKGSLGRNLSYRHTWKLAAYSITLPAIFFTIMEAFQTAVPFSTLVSWFTALIILYLSIKEVRSYEEI
ncbi:DUF1189 domain-containing protein [Actinomycetes bacterium NPDC127524]